MALPDFHKGGVVLSTPNPKRGDWVEAMLTPPRFEPFLQWPEPGEVNVSSDSINWKSYEREYDDGGGAAMAGARYGRCSTFVPSTYHFSYPAEFPNV